MKIKTYKDILSCISADQLLPFSGFVLVAEEPSIFVAALIRRKIVSLLTIQASHMVEDSKHFTDALCNMSLFSATSELFWLVRKDDALTKKEVLLLQNALKNSSTEKRIFYLLSTQEYDLFDWDQVQKPICYIKLPDKITEKDIRFLFEHMDITLSEDKMSYLISYCMQYEIHSFDYIYVSLRMFSLVHARFLPQIKDIFEKEWLLHASKKHLFDAFIAGDKQAFFRMWDMLYEEHSVPFWVLFWFDIVSKVLQYKLSVQEHAGVVHQNFRDQAFYAQCKKYVHLISAQSLLDFLQGLYAVDIRSKEHTECVGMDILFLDFFLKNEQTH